MPVRNAAVSDARNATTSATSRGVPSRPTAVSETLRSNAPVLSASAKVIAVGTRDGATQFTVIPSHSEDRSGAAVRDRVRHRHRVQDLPRGGHRVLPGSVQHHRRDSRRRSDLQCCRSEDELSNSGSRRSWRMALVRIPTAPFQNRRSCQRGLTDESSFLRSEIAVRWRHADGVETTRS